MIPIIPLVIFGASVTTLLFKEHLSNKTSKKNIKSLHRDDALSPTRQNSIQQLLQTQRIAEEKTEIKKHLGISVLSGTLAVTGTFVYPSLLLISLPLIAYSSMPIFKDAYTAGIKQKKAHITQIDAVSIVIGIGSGLITLSALTNIVYFGSLFFLNRTKNTNRNQLINLFDNQQLSHVWVVRDNVEISVPLDQIHIGESIIVQSGETIPVDGVIIEGSATIDQQVLTGESQAAEKQKDDTVFAMTFLLSGRLVIRVIKTGNETIAATITDILNRTENYETLLLTRGEKIANKTVMPTYAIAGISMLTVNPHAMLVTLNSNFSEVIRLSSPLSMLNYIQLASDHGLMIKDGRSLELLKSIDTVVFDKTGTLTLDQPHISNIDCYGDYTEDEILQWAASVEQKQTHPVARAILAKAKEKGLTLQSFDEASYQMGYGIRACLQEHDILVGSYRYMQQSAIEMDESILSVRHHHQEKGYSEIYVAINGQLGGILELQPTIRPEAQAVVTALQQQGMTVYILSGDHSSAVRYLANSLGIEHFIAEALPEDKARVIDELQSAGRNVCFIGDGINDAIALKKATVSISLKQASSVATDAAQIILINEDLRGLLTAFDLAHKFSSNQKIGLGSIGAISVLSMTGAVFLNFTVQSTLLLYNLSVLLGFSTSMFPWLEQKRLQQKPLNKLKKDNNDYS
jgi:heavy metal translocating P-type ATPase